MQRIWTEEQDSISPTIVVEALFYTFIMDVIKGRDVVTCDLSGYFLQTDTKEYLLLRGDRALAPLLVKLDLKQWKEHLRHQGNNLVINVCCDKSIYGTVLAAALLSYKKMVGHFMDWGFEMNPY